MAMTKNVAKGEKVFRIILGVILMPLGFFMTGFWKPVTITAGALLVITAFGGY